MLTSDLVRTKKKGLLVVPNYIKEDDKNLLEVAERLIAIYQESIGQNRDYINQGLEDLFGKSFRVLVYRGLAKLLEDRCEFDAPSDLDPVELRRATFHRAAQFHRAGQFHRDKVMAEVAQEFAISKEKLEYYLFADLKGRQTLESFEYISPAKLLKRYNTALAQGVLYRASQLRILLEEQNPLRYRQLFRAIKFNQLLYTIKWLASNKLEIILDGPMSLFRSSQKYGIQMAVFLPALLLCDNWSLQAEVLWGKKKQARRFELNSKQELYSHYRDTGMYQPPEIKVFMDRFAKLESNWQVHNDCDYLKLDAQEICIPDYTFEHKPSGKVVHLEIFGFWRESALQKRLKQWQGQSNLLLAVSKKLNVDQKLSQEIAHSVYQFREVLQPKEIVQRLNRYL